MLYTVMFHKEGNLSPFLLVNDSFEDVPFITVHDVRCTEGIWGYWDENVCSNIFVRKNMHGFCVNTAKA